MLDLRIDAALPLLLSLGQLRFDLTKSKADSIALTTLSRLLLAGFVATIWGRLAVTSWLREVEQGRLRIVAEQSATDQD